MFKLDTNFINKYKNSETPFGFNGLGELVYYRTYSRLKPDGSNEIWAETVQRVVEGTYTIQKEHINKFNLGWNEKKAQNSAQEMYDRMFNMKFLPPGRGLWGMGSEITTTRRRFAALNNCAFVSTETLNKDYSKPFEFMMDMSMLGVGVGFDTKGEGKLTIKKPVGEFTYEIPDSREGWVEALKLLLNAFFKGEALPEFKYHLIRAKGELIKGFGGTASGPAPLRKMNEQIKSILTKQIGNKITITNIVDIMNIIGVCVVAGNVRRTAQIVFGEPDSEEYLKLKDYSWTGDTYEGSQIHRAEYGWASNNSVSCKLGQNYAKLAAQTAKNGEPGYFWLDNAQDYSRMNNGKDYKDHRATGGNPCLEQTLESYEMCCLVETFPTKHETLDDYLRTLKFAYLYAKTVTLTQTHWPETNRIMLRNRRIGTSVSGIAQFIGERGLDKLKIWLNSGFDALEHYDQVYSDWFAVPKSIKKTSVKPSGTVSLLAGTTPGVHYPESNHYIRRVRIAKDSDLIIPLRKANYHIEEDKTDMSSYVIEFPVHIPNTRTTSDVSIWEQLELAAFLQEHWADNQVSCTVTFTEDEKNQIEPALNYFQYRLKGISFLPKLEKTAYPQMPYEQITEEQYNEMTKNLKKVKFKQIQEDAVPELYCDSESCVMK